MTDLEQRFVEFFDDYTIEYNIKSFPDHCILRDKTGDWFIRLDSKKGYINISFYKMWLIFRKEYGMECEDIRCLMKKLCLKYLNITYMPTMDF